MWSEFVWDSDSEHIKYGPKVLIIAVESLKCVSSVTQQVTSNKFWRRGF